MTVFFNPTGTLNISWDAADLEGQSDGNNEQSGMMTRCKNLRVNQNGQLKTRDGTTTVNATAMHQDIWLVEEMSTLGTRYTFAGTTIYEDESSLETGLTSAQWSAIQYNAFNDTTKQIYALNGTDRKRITAGAVNEWGIAAPATAATLSTGSGAGLTGTYKARYTYVRKVGNAVVAESNPSPVSDPIVLADQSLVVNVTEPTDTQVTHIRLYRTLNGGDLYYLDSEIATGSNAYGYVHPWEATDTPAYISGTGYKFTITDDTNGTENTYSWEETGIGSDTSQATYGRDLDPDDEEFIEPYVYRGTWAPNRTYRR